MGRHLGQQCCVMFASTVFCHRTYQHHQTTCILYIRHLSCPRYIEGVLQEGRPRNVAVAAATFEWNEVLYIDIPYEETLLQPCKSTLLLLEVLQHPSDVKAWQNSRKQFCGGCHRAAWAFLDCSHPHTFAALQRAMAQQQPVALDLQLHRCRTSHCSA